MDKYHSTSVYIKLETRRFDGGEREKKPKPSSFDGNLLNATRLHSLEMFDLLYHFNMKRTIRGIRLNLKHIYTPLHSEIVLIQDTIRQSLITDRTHSTTGAGINLA